jgi:hypothetical protein
MKTDVNQFVPMAPKTYEVRYVENEIKQSPLSPVARAKIINRSGSNYVSERANEVNPGYGPCKNTSCGCFCSKEECDCGNPEFSIYEKSSKKIGNGTASGGTSLGGNAISGDASFTLYRDSRSNGDLKVGTVSAGAYAVNGGVGGGVRASADVVSFKTGGVEIRAGLNLDTGASISDNGLELKAAGFGVSIGEKLEISTPAGGVSCVVQ